MPNGIFYEPNALILDESIRGVDVVAKYETYSRINELAENNDAVIMIPSELLEILGMYDRIYIMNEGRMIGELTVKEASQESIMHIIMEDYTSLEKEEE